MAKFISSANNTSIKWLKALGEKSRNRKKEGLFLVEGRREVERAVSCGYSLETLITESPERETKEAFDIQVEDHWVVTPEVFNQIGYRAGKGEWLGVFKIPQLSLDAVTLQDNPVVLVIETPEKPGNLGAVLRTADAVGVDLVLVTNTQVDLFHPNVIRNSLGGFFNRNVLACSNEEAIAFLKTHQLKVMTTHLEASKSIYETDFSTGLALVLGSEAFGVSGFWISHANERIIIPMEGVVDSLNLSVSAAVVLYEIRRQRLGITG